MPYSRLTIPTIGGCALKFSGATILHVLAGTQPVTLTGYPGALAQVHAACLALLLASNPAACAMPYATAGKGRAHMGQVAGALARGLKHVWMPLSPEHLRLGCGP